MVTVVEIVSIWLLSFFLAVPEAIGFDIIVFNYRNQTMRTCMLNPQSKFMLVGHRHHRHRCRRPGRRWRGVFSALRRDICAETSSLCAFKRQNINGAQR